MPPEQKAPPNKVVPIQKATRNKLCPVINFHLLQMNNMSVPADTTYTSTYQQSKDVKIHIKPNPRATRGFKLIHTWELLYTLTPLHSELLHGTRVRTNEIKLSPTQAALHSKFNGSSVTKTPRKRKMVWGGKLVWGANWFWVQIVLRGFLYWGTFCFRRLLSQVAYDRTV